MPKQVILSPEVTGVLERATVEGPPERPVVKLPEGQLARPLYEAVDKTLKALGGKWDRRSGGHVFTREIDGPLAEALSSGRAIDLKRTHEQFFTPPDLAKRLCDLAGDIECLDVLEPSAGAGAIVFEMIERGAFPTAVEIEAELASALCSETEGRIPVYGADFLEWVPLPPETPEAFDRAIMNPPFSRGQDIDHVRRAFDFLRPQGQLVSVMSPHWTFATDARSREFRSFVEDHDHDWTMLPDGAFKASGTGVSTGILTIWKGAR